MSDRDLDTRLGNIDAGLRNLATAVDRVHGVARGNSSAIDAVERNLGRQIDTLENEQRRTRAAVDGLHEAFIDFVEQDRHDKQRLFAHAALLTVRSEIETKYGQYEDVRRNVHGMLLALDGGLALDATMQLIAENSVHQRAQLLARLGTERARRLDPGRPRRGRARAAARQFVLAREDRSVLRPAQRAVRPV